MEPSLILKEMEMESLNKTEVNLTEEEFTNFKKIVTTAGLLLKI